MKLIRKKGSHYVVQVKDNCSSLTARAQQIIDTDLPRDSAYSCDRQKGRLEQRQVRVYAWSASPAAWSQAGFATLIVVERHTQRHEGEYQTQHFYLSDLNDLTAAKFGQLIRGHWFIENKLHWVKDVILSEDQASVTQANAAENLSTFKDFAINIFRQRGYTSLKQAIITFGNKVPKLWQLIQQI